MTLLYSGLEPACGDELGKEKGIYIYICARAGGCMLARARVGIYIYILYIHR